MEIRNEFLRPINDVLWSNALKILIVDDDPNVIDLLAGLIRSIGFTDIMTAQDGEVGLRIFHEYHPDLIITDIEMPKIDGLELLEKVKKSVPETIVIIISGQSNPENVIEALERHADNFLAKPFSIAKLSQILKKYEKLISENVIYNEFEHQVVSNNFVIEARSDIHHIDKLVVFLLKQCGTLISQEDRHNLKLGLYELIVNAVEHGNFEITYEEKTAALNDLEGKGIMDLYRVKSSDPVLGRRKVIIEFIMDSDRFEWKITDEGPGFDWKNVKNPLTEGRFEMHGRGIYLSGFIFDLLEYIGKGNSVKVTRFRSRQPGKSNFNKTFGGP